MTPGADHFPADDDAGDRRYTSTDASDDYARWPNEVPTAAVAQVVLAVDDAITLKRRAAPAWLTAQGDALPPLPIKPSRLELAVVIALAETFGAALVEDARFVAVLDYIADHGAVKLVQRVLYGARPSRPTAPILRSARAPRKMRVWRRCSATPAWPSSFFARPRPSSSSARRTQRSLRSACACVRRMPISCRRRGHRAGETPATPGMTTAMQVGRAAMLERASSPEKLTAEKRTAETPDARFVGERFARHSPRWRPFAAGADGSASLSPDSQRYAVRALRAARGALRAAFTWWVDVRYLAGNPWKAVNDPVTVKRSSTMKIERALSAALWRKLRLEWDARYVGEDAVQWRAVRAAIF
ncbi:hypothetical protein [Caballeronia glebae]|uniref:hypothetical protein n=1 Tax=Caballeronia glebae TaxID=1777143 RepID=UPI0038BC5D3D